MMSPNPQYVLVTGATGFIGAHIVDLLLARGIRVRGTTRSKAKGDAMIQERGQHAGRLDFVQVADFSGRTGVFDEAIHDVDAVIHVASPLTYDVTNSEKELIIPAINGVRSILEASAGAKVKRLVLTSSFASVMDANRRAPPYFTYTASDWNPLTYAEAADPATSPVVAYRGAKKFAELEAWDFVRERGPSFDLVTLCPPMTFGPIAHPVSSVDGLNESNAQLWKIASGASPLPVSRVPFWVDVRDVARAHVEALLRPEAGGKRYIPASPEHFSYGLAAEIIREEFPWARGTVSEERQPIDDSHGLDGETTARELGFEYIPFRKTVTDLVAQAVKMKKGSP